MSVACPSGILPGSDAPRSRERRIADRRNFLPCRSFFVRWRGLSSNVCSNRSRCLFRSQGQRRCLAEEFPPSDRARFAPRDRSQHRYPGAVTRNRNAPVRQSRWNTGDGRRSQGPGRGRRPGAGRRLRKTARTRGGLAEPAARRGPGERRTAGAKPRPAAPRASAAAPRRRPSRMARRRAPAVRPPTERRPARRRPRRAPRRPPRARGGASKTSPGQGSRRPPRRRPSGSGSPGARSRRCARPSSVGDIGATSGPSGSAPTARTSPGCRRWSPTTWRWRSSRSPSWSCSSSGA